MNPYPAPTMTLGPLALAIALSLSPPAAANFALRAIGVNPDARDGRRSISEGMLRVCYRESRCTSDGSETQAEAAARSRETGIHVRDAYLSRASWLGQVGLGHLDEECQPYEDGAWATRGPWGLNASDHWRWLPPCYQPHWLDIPLVSALVAARKYLDRCEGRDRPRSGWCKRT